MTLFGDNAKTVLNLDVSIQNNVLLPKFTRTRETCLLIPLAMVYAQNRSSVFLLGSGHWRSVKV